jgi:hypothetical protein
LQEAESSISGGRRPEGSRVDELSYSTAPCAILNTAWEPWRGRDVADHSPLMWGDRRPLRDALGVREFVNADSIASGLSAFRPGTVAISAGRIRLARMRQLAAARVDFAFGTTLATRSFVPWLAGYGGGRGEGALPRV